MPRHLIALALVVALAPAQESRRAAFDASSWTSLFDGNTLGGWVTRGGRYDGDASWTVEDHAICGREGPNHAGGLLYTDKKYACFILSLEVWMTKPNDSGIFVRMVPNERGAQITLDDCENGEIGAVYSDEFLAHNGKARRKWQGSTWNRVEVRVTGLDMHLEAWINGEKVTDHQILPGTGGFAQTGLIGLQVHGSRNDPPGTIVKFRDVRIRELPIFNTADFTCDADGNMTPTEAGAKRGWKLLWDGKNAEAWTDRGFLEPPEGASRPAGGTLESRDDFENFQLQCDFRIEEKGANSGVFLRAARDGSNPAFSGCEIQILDDENWEKLNKSKLKPWQFCGSIYGSSAPRVQGAPRSIGRWNTYRIQFKGSQLRVELNGFVVQEVDVTTLEVPSGEKKFADRAKTGFIGLQRHDASFGAVRFRNVFVLPNP